MALQDRSVRLTYDDYLRFPQDGRRHEILNGEHYVTEAPGIGHQIIQQRLNFALSPIVERVRLGQILSAPVAVLLSPHDIVQPDLLFVARKRLKILTERYVQGAPSLVVEILSESSQQLDRHIKLEIYEHAGVREYWIVDGIVDDPAGTITVYRAGDTGATVFSASAGYRLTSSLFPGLKIRLSDLFAPAGPA